MKVGIFGSGFVGSMVTYAFAMQGIGREIVMVDRDTPQAAAKHDRVVGRNSTSIRNSTDGSRHDRRTEVIGNKR